MTAAFGLSSGDATAAVLASTAIPALFPRVEIDGRSLFDGGVVDVDNTPINRAVAHDHVDLLVLPRLCPRSESATNFRHSRDLTPAPGKPPTDGQTRTATGWGIPNGVSRPTHDFSTSTFADTSEGHAA